MTREQLIESLSTVGNVREVTRVLLTDEGKQQIRSRLDCDFADLFWEFLEIMQLYDIPIELLTATEKPVEGEARILDVYEEEMSSPSSGSAWSPNLLPFAWIGNGDCLCVDTASCSVLPVYYMYHEDGSAEVLADSFENWLLGLPSFFNG